MSVRHTILIEPYGGTEPPGTIDLWCAREYVQHGDESRTTRVLHTAPTRGEVADWLAEQTRQAGGPRGYIKQREAEA